MDTRLSSAFRNARSIRRKLSSLLAEISHILTQNGRKTSIGCLFAWAKNEVDLGGEKRMDSHSPVFVSLISHSYSGSTLLAILLGAHPEIATVGEMNGLNSTRVDISRYRCSCGQLLTQCQFWRTIKHNMENKGFEFEFADFGTRFVPASRSLGDRLQWGSLGSNALESMRDSIAQIWPGHREQLNRLVARNEAFVGAVLEATGKRVFVDTSKSPFRFRYLSRFSALDVRVIHLVRDVKGTVASTLRRSRHKSASQAARSWVRAHSGIKRISNIFYIDLKVTLLYEYFCKYPSATLHDLCRFIGVDSSIDLLDLQAIPEYHVIGNSLRERDILRIELDERWKKELDPEQLKTIDRTAGHLSQRYGYK
jgi:hypothetical protein